MPYNVEFKLVCETLEALNVCLNSGIARDWTVYAKLEDPEIKVGVCLICWLETNSNICLPVKWAWAYSTMIKEDFFSELLLKRGKNINFLRYSFLHRCEISFDSCIWKFHKTLTIKKTLPTGNYSCLFQGTAINFITLHPSGRRLLIHCRDNIIRMLDLRV